MPRKETKVDMRKKKKGGLENFMRVGRSGRKMRGKLMKKGRGLSLNSGDECLK